VVITTKVYCIRDWYYNNAEKPVFINSHTYGAIKGSNTYIVVSDDIGSMASNVPITFHVNDDIDWNDNRTFGKYFITEVEYKESNRDTKINEIIDDVF
jgi:hypothetical protein